MKKEILLAVFVGLFLVSAFFGISLIKADQNTDLGELISTKELLLNTQETYKIVKYRKNGQTSWVLEKSKFISKESLILSGFEDEVSQCQNSILDIESIKVICLKGVVGVHSENLELVNIETLDPINFIDEETEYSSVVSDVPNFQFQQNKLNVDMRNYDKDPLTEAIRLEFNYKEGKFVFDKKENITYDEGNNSLFGDI